MIASSHTEWWQLPELGADGPAASAPSPSAQGTRRAEGLGWGTDVGKKDLNRKKIKIKPEFAGNHHALLTGSRLMT